MKGVRFGDIEKIRKKVSQTEKGRGTSQRAEKLEEFSLLGFVFQVRGLWIRSKSSTVLTIPRVLTMKPYNFRRSIKFEIHCPNL